MGCRYQPPIPAQLSPLRLFALLAGLGCGWLSAQMTPDAPIGNFRLPFFGEDGYKTWELRGLSGEFASARVVKITSLELLTFSGDQRVVLENTIRSPQAWIFLDESRAEGPSSLFVAGPGYTIEGRDWLWDGRQRRIEVRAAARVAFDGSLNILE